MARRASLPLLLALALGVAGCGGGGGKPYTAAATAPCLQKKGFTDVTTSPGKVGFVAAFADNGGVRATSPDGNVLTIAFAADANGVAGTEQAFRRHAPAKLRPHLHDIMESQGNAVLVWTVTPGPRQLSAATGCLRP